MPTTPKLLWDWGTAYDLFISLEVLQNPGNFGVRGSWAASVQKRLPVTDREVLEQGLHLFHLPFHWIYRLPTPKRAATVLSALAQIPARERLATLTYFKPDCQAGELLKNVAERKKWTQGDFDQLSQIYSCQEGGKSTSEETLITILDGWSRTEEFGDAYLEALSTYVAVFFSEEEQRIQPAIEQALARAQSLAEKLDFPDLIEELSQGLRFEEIPQMDELVLAPSYWLTPLMYLGITGPGCGVWVFGARPAEQSLVPGGAVPEVLIRGLKALSDPTRLRILHYLSQEPLSPAELARRLRLRPPTVTHHLQTLRLSGLVQVRLGGDGKEKKSFATRSENVRSICRILDAFLIGDEE